MDDTRRALVQIHPSGEPATTGLGIIAGEFVFTCAHFDDLIQLPTRILETPLFEVRRLHDGVQGTLAMLVATSTDFMALASDGVFVNMSEGGPTESSYDVLTDEDGNYNAIRPSMLEFSGAKASADISGFFFSQDGKRVHQVELSVSRNSPIITYYSNDMLRGCSGGPIFTNDLHLIGINTNMGDIFPGHHQRHCLGRRIDLCSPLFLHRCIEWRTLRFE